jgi:hypothetical protein
MATAGYSYAASAMVIEIASPCVQGTLLLFGNSMALPRIDITGQRFGRWTAISYADSVWTCRCDCGTERRVVGKTLRNGSSKSCGCYNAEVAGRHLRKHGMAHRTNVEYKAWCQMRTRCMNRNGKNWADYGGRGIEVCERWNDFTAFYADMGPRPSPKHSLDRLDVNGNYEPGNCRWATVKEQRRNIRTNRLLTHHGKTMTVAAWADELGVRKGILYTRLFNGWSDEKVLTQPVRHW